MRFGLARPAWLTGSDLSELGGKPSVSLGGFQSPSRPGSQVLLAVWSQLGCDAAGHGDLGSRSEPCVAVISLTVVSVLAVSGSPAQQRLSDGSIQGASYRHLRPARLARRSSHMQFGCSTAAMLHELRRPVRGVWPDLATEIR